MFSWNFTTFCLLIIAACRPSLENTVGINTADCFGLPESPITVAGALVQNSQTPGRTLCYFASPESEQYLSVRFDSLTLPRRFGSCPTLTVNEYSSVRSELIDDEDTNLRVAMIVPSDPKALFTANCTNYEKLRGRMFQTLSPGLKLELIFDPLNSDGTGVIYILTLTSFVIGPSFNCPSGTFRCWGNRSTCIPESLTCDGIDNCPDGSDENSYYCTGRINGLPVPLLVIIIVVAFLVLVLIVTSVVFILRKRRTKAQKEEKTWIDMTIRQPYAAENEPLNEKNVSANA
ncbi:unnamed protein product [Calicophoron daubneyi]|uniref:CUB domain-containing protein n=1 Tax=Calicophoron daubneyi TaxID=300641 RepID=A0AAV2T1N1_CALDB